MVTQESRVLRFIPASISMLALACLGSIAEAQGTASSFSSSGVRLQFEGWSPQPLDNDSPELILRIEPNVMNSGVYRTCELERRSLPPVPNMTQEAYNARVLSSGGGQMGDTLAARVVRRSVAMVNGVAVIDLDLDASQSGGPAVMRNRMFARGHSDGGGDYFKLTCAAMVELPPELSAEFESILGSLQIDSN